MGSGEKVSVLATYQVISEGFGMQWKRLPFLRMITSISAYIHVSVGLQYERVLNICLSPIAGGV